MIRKTILMTAAIFVLMLGALGAPSADAQGTATPEPTPTPPLCTVVGYNNCVAYPDGGFGDANKPTTPTPTPSPAPIATATPVPAATTAAAGGGTAGGGEAIAFTGAESEVLGYVGAGMIGFGAIALAAARRRREAELD